MKEKRKITIKIGIFFLIPFLFYGITWLLPGQWKNKVNNFYQEAKKNEVYIYGNSLFSHGIILVEEKDNWESLLKKIKSLKKNYTIKKSLNKNELPKDFLLNYKVNLDEYLIYNKALTKKNKNGKNRPRKPNLRKLRYR